MSHAALPLCMVALAATPASAQQQLACTALEACAATTCRDAAEMDLDFAVTYDDATASVRFNDPAQPSTEMLHFRGVRDDAAVYMFSENDLTVALQLFAAQTPPRVRLAFGASDAPETANQIFATCAEGASQ